MSSVRPDIIVQMSPTGALIKKSTKVAVNVVLIFLFAFVYAYAFEEDESASNWSKFTAGFHRSLLIQTTVGLGNYSPRSDQERNTITFQVLLMFVVNFLL